MVSLPFTRRIKDKYREKIKKKEGYCIVHTTLLADKKKNTTVLPWYVLKT